LGIKDWLGGYSDSSEFKKLYSCFISDTWDIKPSLYSFNQK